MGKVEVLISAMHQKDFSIFQNTNINTDALLINQCDENGSLEIKEDFGTLRMISTKERGLSRSRNMALKNANGKYCLICDDDELLYTNYEDCIIAAYEQYPFADIICFQIKRSGKKYSDKIQKIGYMKALRIASWQISMKVENIINAGILFDTNYGSGTPVGSGEENIFLYDCLKAKLKIIYVPICIGEVKQQKSNWFKGFTEDYFMNRGRIIRRLMGKWFGYLYCIYFSLSKFPKYHSNLSFTKAFLTLCEGMRER